MQGPGPSSLALSHRLTPVETFLSLVAFPSFLELGVRHSNGSSGLSCSVAFAEVALKGQNLYLLCTGQKQLKEGREGGKERRKEGER